MMAAAVAAQQCRLYFILVLTGVAHCKTNQFNFLIPKSCLHKDGNQTTFFVTINYFRIRPFVKYILIIDDSEGTKMAIILEFSCN